MVPTFTADEFMRLLLATPEQCAILQTLFTRTGGGPEATVLLVERMGTPGGTGPGPTAGSAEIGRCTVAPANTRFLLRRGLNHWTLMYEGHYGLLGDNRAIKLVAQLLKHPSEKPLHASELEQRVDGSPLIDGFGGIGRAEDDERPAVEVGEVAGGLREGTGRKFVGHMSLPALKILLAELRAASQDLTLPVAERAEAHENLYKLLRAHGRGGKLVGEAGRSVDRVRKQIKTLIVGLLATKGQTNAVLRAFGRHLEVCLWLPSMGGRKRLGASGKAGCFTYEPPPDVVWQD